MDFEIRKGEEKGKGICNAIKDQERGLGGIEEDGDVAYYQMSLIAT